MYLILMVTVIIYKVQHYESQVSSGNHWAIGVFRWENVNSNKDTIWSYETNGSPKRDYANE